MMNQSLKKIIDLATSVVLRFVFEEELDIIQLLITYGPYHDSCGYVS